MIVGLPGSLYSDMLCEGLRALPLLALRTWWLNLTSFLGRAMVKEERAVAPGILGGIGAAGARPEGKARWVRAGWVKEVVLAAGSTGPSSEIGGQVTTGSLRHGTAA